jgi:hypothetical protein
VTLPPELLEADARLHALHQQVRFSAYLNPLNAAEARAAFLTGTHPAPPFAYAPADWADDLLDALARLRVPREHPLGDALHASVQGTALTARALRDRTGESFHHLAEHAEWYPTPRGLAGTLPDLALAPLRDDDEVAIPHAQLLDALRGALPDGSGWTVVSDPVMSARVLVAAAQREVRVAPSARFRRRDLRALVAHEIHVHVARARAGQRQPLRLFETGLHGAGATEEGLALHAEARVGALHPGTLARQRHVLRAVAHAREAGFAEVYEALVGDVGPASAWSIALRVKRGLADPARPGVYAKDTVYLEGFLQVHDTLSDAPARALAELYTGKVGVAHPVREWLAEGWLLPGEVPALWSDPLTG